MMTLWGAIPTLDRVLDEAVRSAPRSGERTRTFPIAADVRETTEGYTFHVDLPGVKVDDLEITLDRQLLVIRGERRFQALPHEKVTCGRPHGAFVASYALPEGIDGENLTADLAEGVLTITVPKQAQVRPRRIPISGHVDRTDSAG